MSLFDAAKFVNAERTLTALLVGILCIAVFLFMLFELGRKRARAGGGGPEAIFSALALLYVIGYSLKFSQSAEFIDLGFFIADTAMMLVYLTIGAGIMILNHRMGGGAAVPRRRAK